MAKKLSLAKNKTKQDIVNLPEPDEVDIDTLSDKDHVRLRRGMYLPNQNYCAYEILDNAVDEFMAGYCKNIWLQIEPDTTMRIQDDGRGVPLRPSKKDPNKPMVQVALGELKSGGKFNQQAENAVKTGGLNGTGASAVNFTCDHFVATVTQKGIMHQIAWEKGELVQPLTVLGKADEDDIQNGTLIELVPDKTIWVDDDYDINAIVKRAEQLTFLNSGLSIHLDIDYNNKKVETSFCNPEGLTAYINKLSEKKEKIIDPVSIRSEFKGTKVGDIEIEVALGYNTGYSEEIYAFTNNVPNPLGGHHIVGFKEGSIKKTASLIGLVVITIISFLLKDMISVILYENLPFFNFGGLIKGVEMINVIMYELIAFFIVFAALSLILRIILAVTGIVEKLLKMTIILAVPSKILGAIVGAIEYYIYAFIILFIITLPVFNIKIVNESKYKNFILNNTPLVSTLANKTLDTYKEVYDAIDSHNGNNTEEVNAKVLDVLLKYDIISVESTEKLIKANKVHVKNPDEILNKYREVK